jgi:DNA (cytosine-5)-methyltransferase 1
MVQRENGANEMNHGSLFSGIGGFDLAAEWAGWENIFHCEWNPFGQKILKHYWPQAHSFNDITKTDFTPYANKIDILTGGFPCQPYSSAGKRKGKEDERHLWPEMLRAIREIQPRWVVGENVLGLVNWSGGLVFHEVQADLEAEGYEVQPFLLPAAAVGAPHRRDRIWFVAHATGRDERSGKYRGLRSENAEANRERTQTIYNALGSNGNEGNATDTEDIRRKDALENGELEGRRFRFGNQSHTWNSFPSQSPICSGDDGLPTQLDGITFSKWRQESIKGYGNAIVPQVAYQIFKSINQYEAWYKEKTGQSK